MTKKAVVTSTVGFFIIGLLAWTHGLPLTGWVGMAPAGIAAAISPLSVILVVLAILAYLNDETIDGVILFSVAALVWSHSIGAMMAEGAYGWNVLLWGLLFLAIFCGARKGCTIRALFALAFGLALVADAIKHWSGSAHAYALIEGYLDLLAGLLALVISLAVLAANRSRGKSTPPA